MLSNDDFNAIISSIRETIGDENSALISDNLTTLIANQTASTDNIATLQDENKKMKARNEELLLANGKLFQKLGSPLSESHQEEIVKDEPEEKILDINDVINEKGEII